VKITLTATIEFPRSTKAFDLNAYAGKIANRICQMVAHDAGLPNQAGCWVEWEHEYDAYWQTLPRDYERKDWN
jgi:hypothetical protein